MTVIAPRGAGAALTDKAGVRRNAGWTITTDVLGIRRTMGQSRQNRFILIARQRMDPGRPRGLSLHNIASRLPSPVAGCPITDAGVTGRGVLYVVGLHRALFGCSSDLLP